MASEGSPDRSHPIGNLFPFLFGLNPLQENDGGARDRIVLVNPFTRTMVVIESSSTSASSGGFDSLFDDLISRKSGRAPASKASIDALQSVEIGCGDDDDEEEQQQCVVCLEEWEAGEKAKEMPCKHKFHGGCIEKWLKIHGSCPVCRYEMPVDDESDDKNIRREIWVEFGFGTSSSSSTGGENTTTTSGSNEATDSWTTHLD